MVIFQIDDRLRCMDGCNSDGLLALIQLTARSLNPPESRTLRSSDRNKTLEELGIDATTQIIIHFQNHSYAWNNRLASAESSPDQTFTLRFDFFFVFENSLF